MNEANHSSVRSGNGERVVASKHVANLTHRGEQK